MAKRKEPAWTRDERILLLDLYFRLDYPNSMVPEDDPRIAEFSWLLGRLPIHDEEVKGPNFRNAAGIIMKLGNLLSIDPSYPGKGLEGAAQGDKRVWREFAQDAERLRKVAETIVAHAEAGESPEISEPAPGEERSAKEGRLLFAAHLRRERDSSLTRDKKRWALETLGELACEACGFNFAEVYGSVGEGFIECHHIVPLADLKPGTRTRLADLALVCSNCHRMLHRASGPGTIEELRGFINAHP